MTLVDLLLDKVRRLPAKPALFWKDRAWSFPEVGRAVRRYAGALAQAGIGPGDRVAVFLPNAPETVFVHFAIQLLGAARVPVNAAYTASEAGHPISFSEARIVITDPLRAPIAEEAAPGVPCILVERLQEGPEGAAHPPEDEDLSLLCFTSGTSGKPKGVPLTHRNLESNIRGLAEAWEWTESDILLLCLPLMHLHGLGNGLNGWVQTGCALVLQEKFHPEGVIEGLERHQATMFFGVPAMYHRLLEAGRRYDLASMRLWVSGSAPLDRGLEDRFAAVFGKPLINRYGMTETAMITANPASSPRRGSVGRPLPGTEVKVEAPGGEVLVRGPGVFAGYWKGETDVTRLEGGWFRTGDVGYLEDGYLYLTGRAKDIIISGGTNIAPLEIEEVLLQHPGVAEAVVVPVPDPALGEVIRAVVVPRGELSESDLFAWCAPRIAKFKQPRSVRIVEGPLPRNAMQKLDRARARELFAE